MSTLAGSRLKSLCTHTGCRAILAIVVALAGAPGAHAGVERLDLLAHLAAADPLLPTREIDLGTREARRDRALASGWLLDESDGTSTYVWAEGPHAALKLRALGPAGSKLTFRAYGPPAPISMTVSIAGAALDVTEIAEGWQEYSVPVPAGALSAGTNLLDLDFVGSFEEPAGQKRTLAVALDFLRVGDGGPSTKSPAGSGATGWADDAGRLHLPAHTGISWKTRIREDASLRLRTAGGAPAATVLSVFSRSGGKTLGVPFGPKADEDGSDLLELSAPPTGDTEILLTNDNAYPIVLDHIGLERSTAASRSTDTPPSVLLVVLDALRADHVHSLGYHRETTPCIDRLADESVVFTEAFAQGPMTLVSMASLLTGTHAPTHGVRPNVLLNTDIPTVAEAIRAKGYETALITANPFLGKAFGLTRGFDDIRELFRTAAAEERGVDGVVRAELMTESTLEFLATPRTRPSFVLAHYLQPHAPYAPPRSRWGRCGSKDAGFDGRGSVLLDATEKSPEAARALRQDAVDCYDDNLLYVDGEVCRIVEQLELLDLLETTVVVLTADHGEQFLEHGAFQHPGEYLFDEQIHVPLLIRAPGKRPRRTSALVELVDLSATLVYLAGAKTLPESAGRLLPLSEDGGGAEATSVLSFGPGATWQQGGWRSSIRTKDHKLIRKTNGEIHRIFDLRNDAAEIVDLAGDPPAEAEHLREELEVLWKNAPAPRSRGATAIDADLRKQLEALGYLR
ncbi:MAG: sulfatase [Candidatus Binatia bacterium]|nr:sulfatase [Candidatus Binatia bacterium]